MEYLLLLISESYFGLITSGQFHFIGVIAFLVCSSTSHENKLLDPLPCTLALYVRTRLMEIVSGSSWVPHYTIIKWYRIDIKEKQKPPSPWISKATDPLYYMKLLLLFWLRECVNNSLGCFGLYTNDC